MPLSVWTVALAAGAGTRLSSVTGGVPKQYWRRPDRRTLLGETLDRLGRLAPAERTVVVAAAGHRPYLDDHAEWLGPTHVILQPKDRGTAAGVALALIPVLERDPDAIVVISPSDHGVRDERLFHDGLERAIRHVEHTHEVVICGVESCGPAEDFGWILPGQSRGPHGARGVVAFLEKPERQVASALYRLGAAWNTMITVARARTLLDLYHRYLPGLAGTFVQALRVPAPARAQWLDAAYDGLEPMDFCRDLMAVARGLCTMVWPRVMGWSDLGTPDRLAQWEGGRDEPVEALPLRVHEPPPRTVRHVNPRGSIRIGTTSIA